MNKFKVYLVHGENDYLIYKDLKDLKTSFGKDGVEYREMLGSKSLLFKDIFESLNSSSFFSTETTVIIRDIGERNSIYPFIDDLVEYLPKLNDSSNTLYIYHKGKVAKNTRIYKAIDKIGSAKEFSNPSRDEILSVINKSIKIESNAAELLADYVGGNLFLLRNELKKLSNLIDEKKKQIEVQDIEESCIKLFTQDEVWGVSQPFMNYLLDSNDKNKVKLLSEVDYLLKKEVATMQILYGFYSNVLNFIKMKQLAKKGKGFRECLSLGYYFVKEYFNKKDALTEQKLFEINSKLLNYEYLLKTGDIDEVNGLRKLILSL